MCQALRDVIIARHLSEDESVFYHCALALEIITRHEVIRVTLDERHQLKLTYCSRYFRSEMSKHYDELKST